jgi:hypothetical protein
VHQTKTPFSPFINTFISSRNRCQGKNKQEKEKNADVVSLSYGLHDASLFGWGGSLDGARTKAQCCPPLLLQRYDHNPIQLL